MTTHTVTQELDELRRAIESAVETFMAALADTLVDVEPAPDPTPAPQPWPTEDIILITRLTTEPDAPPTYAIRAEDGSYLLLDGNVLWQEDAEIEQWEPLYRHSDVLTSYALAGLPAGAQVRDRDGRVWTQVTVAWRAEDTLEQMDDQDLMLLRGPLILVHDPGAQQ